MKNSFIKNLPPVRWGWMVAGAGLLVLLFVLSGCGGKPTATPLSPGTPTQALPTSTATAVPPKALTVCLGQEPASLFPLSNPSPSARSVLAAVYDGPIDSNSYGYQPVILKTLPSLENGDAQVFPKSVFVGDEVVDTTGTPVTLVAGTKVRPSGCRSDSCAVTYDGKAEIQMDQMQVTFRLLPGLTWSDGEPLTADDSVYSFEYASSRSTPDYVAERTKTYEAADELTVQWWGKPGYIDPTYFTNFWMPLPKHQWSQIPAANISTAGETTRSPMGWGPFVIDEWVEKDHITLVKNPHYFRAGEGLPKLDTLTFRFTADAETAVADLVAGKCDILDPSIDLDSQVSLLRTMAGQGQAQAFFTTAPVMEQLAFGIRPAIYDNGYRANPDQPDFFSDVRVRQAAAMCIDRQKIIDTILYGLSSVPATFAPSEYPFYNSSARTYPYDVTAASALLDQAGWKSPGSDPSQMRQSLNVKNVPNGTAFEVTYFTTAASQRIQVANLVADSLAQCGIKVDVQFLDQSALYAVGPDGVLFGRRFELAEFAMGTTGLEPPCEWFTTSEIPASGNHWIGTNVSGYSSLAFDEACGSATQTLNDEPAHADAYQQAQAVFAEDLPVLPLYWRVKTAAARTGVCGFKLDPTAGSALWNIESVDIGNCQP